MSNAVDMAKYMNFHLSNTDKNGNEFMTTANFNALHQQHRKMYSTTVNTQFGNEEVPTIENGYGLGWKRGLYRGTIKIDYFFRFFLSIRGKYNILFFMFIHSKIC